MTTDDVLDLNEILRRAESAPMGRGSQPATLVLRRDLPALVHLADELAGLLEESCGLLSQHGVYEDIRGRSEAALATVRRLQEKNDD